MLNAGEVPLQIGLDVDHDRVLLTAETGPSSPEAGWWTAGWWWGTAWTEGRFPW